MFEVLVYLFENYFESDLRPDEHTLARELSAAGFEEEDIDRAFDWYSALNEMTEHTSELAASDRASYRIFTDAENKKINGEGRSFLMFLEQAGVLNPAQRELVIDRAMALPQTRVALDEIKWIVLIALWSQGKARDYLFIEDVIFNEQRPTMH